MTIAQALKEKNKKIGLISRLRDRLETYNSVERGTVREYDPRTMFEELNHEIKSLVGLKQKIHQASAPVRHQIFFQSELKAQIRFLRTVSTSNGFVRDRHSREDRYQLEAVITRSEMDQILETLEKEVEMIQDELDQFNHKTLI
jgi:hypothetical protein